MVVMLFSRLAPYSSDKGKRNNIESVTEVLMLLVWSKGDYTKEPFAVPNG